MSRINSGGYAHRIAYLGHDCYQISWGYDLKFIGSRLRYPKRMVRDTDKAGAERFAKKWQLQMPEETT